MATSPSPEPFDDPPPGSGAAGAAAGLRAAFGSIVSAGAAPYGYTVSIWSTGAVVAHEHGLPGVGQVFLFAAGALLGFGALAVAARGTATMDTGDVRARIVAGALHWFAVGVAVGVAALLARLPAVAAWPLGSLVATL
ncbi:MAG: hypothetical protein AB1416_01160, partial [Actinomycetota bacterium]